MRTFTCRYTFLYAGQTVNKFDFKRCRVVGELPHEEVEGVDEGPAVGGAQHQQQQDAVRRQEHTVTQELNTELIRNTP